MKFRNIFFLLLIFGVLWYIYADHYKQDGVTGVWNGMKQDFYDIRDSEFFHTSMEYANDSIGRISNFISDQISKDEKNPVAPKPELQTPLEQTFSIHNIEIAEEKADVESNLPENTRITANEYNRDWHTYHEHYQNFVMVAYDAEHKVSGLFTNQDLLSSKDGITLSNTKQEVRETYGEPIQSIQKGMTRYRLNENEEQDTFKVDGNYVTFFYDKHQGEQIAAIQIISEEMEAEKKSYYGETNAEIAQGFEYQLFDLTNAARAKFDKRILDWYEPAQSTARNHSLDMASHNYFSHDNLEGLSPFDRLTNDGISYRAAGENLAMGQSSSIYAHQGLMNSENHRKNILHDDFRLMAVGVAQHEDGQPYYTEAYLTQ